MNTRQFVRCAVALTLALPAAWAAAQAFPSKPVTLVVPFPAGGALDVVARGLAEQMRTDLGQPVVVENRAGAGGTVGSAAVARAAPDGYTLLFGSVATHAIAPGLYPKLPYDPINDYAPITQLTSSPLVLAVSPALKVNSVAELIAAAKAQPGKINYASTGNGTAVHIAGEAFRKATGIDVLHVPYKGGPQAITAMLSGESGYMLANPQLVMPMVQVGKLRALAVTGAVRIESLPGVPTLKEAGVPGVDVTTWFALWAPNGTPPAAIERLNTSARKALGTPEMKRQLDAQGDSPVGSSVADFTAFVRAEHAHWVTFVQSAGIKVD
jgi:tripartite-type tricarboxylate transporter receptor subunit TctC